MDNSKYALAKYLAYAGTLPFVGSWLFALFSDSFFGLEYSTIALTYGAVICSFVAGIHWGIYLFKDAPVNLFLHSNIAALMSWLSLLLLPQMGFALLIVCFLYLLLIDIRLQNAGIHHNWFMRLRYHATTIVCSSLIINILIYDF